MRSMSVIRSVTWRGAPLAFTLLVLAGPGFGSRAVHASEPPAPGKLVDIGGRHLHIHCTGSGSPAVIVENGSRGFSICFILVQPPIAKFTQILTFDPAG